jgi:S-layer protein
MIENLSNTYVEQLGIGWVTPEKTGESASISLKTLGIYRRLTGSLTTGSDTGASFIGGSGNDTFVANNVTAGDTWTVGDAIDGGAGTDTFKVTQTNAIALPTGATVANIENVELLSGGIITLNTATGFAGLTSLKATSKNGATTNTTLTAAATTDITSTETNLGVVGTGGQLVINGGKNVVVAATGTTDNTGGTAFNAATGAGQRSWLVQPPLLPVQLL